MSVQAEVRTAAPERGTTDRKTVSTGRHRVAVAALGLFGVGLAVMLYGGYEQGWTWTGVDGDKTLWDWLQLLLLPVAFGSLPLLLRRKGPMRRSRRVLLVATVGAFAGLVLAGYLVPWDWTGFSGNTLWDWLTLLLLPVTIAGVRWFREERQVTRRHRVIAATALLGFAAVVAAGYLVPWAWTGFTGNTAFDWLKLLLLPVLFPTVVVPAAAAWLAKEQDEQDKPVTA